MSEVWPSSFINSTYQGNLSKQDRNIKLVCRKIERSSNYFDGANCSGILLVGV